MKKDDKITLKYLVTVSVPKAKKPPPGQFFLAKEIIKERNNMIEALFMISKLDELCKHRFFKIKMIK